MNCFIPNTQVPIEYYLCENKTELKNWIYQNGTHTKFPVEFVNELIELEWERLQSIKAVLEPYLNNGVVVVTY